MLECAANLACVGAEPLGLTNCLNFGNPEKPHVAWQLTEAVAGLAEGCRALDIPVVGGNVSLYNEAAEGPIYPTPVVGLVGLHARSRDGRPAGLRAPRATRSRSSARSRRSSPPPSWRSCAASRCRTGWPTWTPARCGRSQEAVRDAVRAGDLESAHDVAEGGLAVALAECCLAGGLGAEVAIEPDGDCAAALFGEGVGGFVVTGGSDALAALAGARPWCGSAAWGATRCGSSRASGRWTWVSRRFARRTRALGLLFP